MIAVYIVLIIIGLGIIALAARSVYEVHCIVLTRYVVNNAKSKGKDSFRVLFVSDLHGRTYGKNNERLIGKIKEAEPDCILIGGDLCVLGNPSFDGIALDFLSQAARLAPVYMAPGNHEKGMESFSGEKERFLKFKESLMEAGVNYLSNETAVIRGAGDNGAGEDVTASEGPAAKKALPEAQGAAFSAEERDPAEEGDGGAITVTGLDVNYSYYRRARKKKLKAEDVRELVGRAPRNSYNIMLAHDPEFFAACAEEGYDLVLAGHYHGGVIGLGAHGALISPRLTPFPRYGRGRFDEYGASMIVSAGCGSHSVNVRLFNKPEILLIEIAPAGGEAFWRADEYKTGADEYKTEGEQ